ncbi:leucine zipper-EF-hand-containing transmembrane protein 1, putative [Pediculus humanus corporis]|uniref:Mitochondrial proton/calcium exchanger protein n=1 Tax=Pediculus humanus subsp. corporis TaxID=121224 RepID=E0VJ68_PEDHC|nr:leucine zipper-EF-hand-containing transmembrane protein 1, putative [Pediculus humanus corporis]EEB13424.1 leucine zipper-EF-hand-containing transmembrane protein 1, putative [Pediculus humanus corporis]
MQAIFKSPSNIVIRSKVIQRDGCCCQGWKKHKLFLSGTWLQERLIFHSARCVIGGGPTLKNIFTYHSHNYISPSYILIHSGLKKESLILIRNFSVGKILLEKEPLKPSSKVETTVKAIKEKASAPEPVKIKKPLKERIWDEILHYYHGFRLLFIDINISRKLLWRVLNGKTLSRREHRLLVRTVGDLFRLLPFSVFIIVPFMELLLPVAIKLFPNMLPSTFQTATERDDKLKQSLKVRLEMAKFLQTTLDDMSVQSKDKNNEAAKEFTEFFKKIRTSGEAPSNEAIIKFSTLFEDEIILDSLSRQQLTALCRVLDINPMGTTNLLRFQIRMRLRNLAADDKMIVKEGIESLTVQELQTACQARAMRAYGVSADKLKTQLNQWLDLSVNEKVPPSLLLLSRALMLPDTIAATDQLKATISALPDSAELKAKVAISEREGALDNKTKIELIRAEEKIIQEERAEESESKKASKEVSKEQLIDTAPILKTDVGLRDFDKSAEKKKEASEEITTQDIETLENALDALGKEKKKLIVEKEELNELKEEMHDYEEDVKELTEVLATKEKKPEIRETKAAKNLYKKVNSMISKLDVVLDDLENKGEKLKASGVQEEKEKSEELVKIDELMGIIKRLQKVPDESKIHQISKVLEKIDDDRDGAISVDEVLKVIELIGKEHVQLTTKQLDEILDLMDKEEALELEDQIEKALEKQSLAEKITPPFPKKETGSEITSEKKPESIEKSSPKHASASASSAAMSVSPNGSPTITEPKDINNDTKKNL